jgi:hypothetical protein
MDTHSPIHVGTHLFLMVSTYLPNSKANNVGIPELAWGNPQETQFFGVSYLSFPDFPTPLNRNPPNQQPITALGENSTKNRMVGKNLSNFIQTIQVRHIETTSTTTVWLARSRGLGPLPWHTRHKGATLEMDTASDHGIISVEHL